MRTEIQPLLFETPAVINTEKTTGIADTTLSLTQVCMEFAGVKRVPRYCQDHRENDAEHSFMVALVGSEISREYFPQLDDGLVARFGLVHDLVELKTGDVATFKLTEDEAHAKESAEHDALPHVASRLPRHIANLLMRYEAQLEDEAVFIKHVDKMLPVAVDILGPGKQVLAEDYDVCSKDQLDTAETELSARLYAKLPYPEFEILHQARTELAERFADQYVL